MTVFPLPCTDNSVLPPLSFAVGATILFTFSRVDSGMDSREFVFSASAVNTSFRCVPNSTMVLKFSAIGTSIGMDETSSSSMLPFLISLTFSSASQSLSCALQKSLNSAATASPPTLSAREPISSPSSC